ncbi:MAG: hypothetical protein JNG90_19505 [Planctomycetaceae bacterium]|nr:hypothetical protein [Planctomycetaceae bacterium]
MIAIYTQVADPAPPGLLKKQIGQFMGRALGEEATFWHQNFLQLHFDPPARFRYDYKPRSPAWRKRKRALAAQGKVKKGGLADLVASGVFEEALMSFFTVRAYQHYATLSMRGRSFVQVHLRDRRQPNYVAEITAIHPSERPLLNDVLNRAMTRQVDQFRAPQTTTTK